MKSLIIYDSYFGNTQKVAEEISKNFTDSKLLNITDFKPENLKNIELLIVGSPTRAFSPSERTTKFLNSLPSNSLEGIDVASFDTRMDVEKAPSKILKFLAGIFGFAAEPITKKLVKKGGEQILEPIGFNVKDTEGPLEDGELERIQDWTKGITK